jgi:hypothetical protein
MRRQIVALRSAHSNNQSVVILLNKLLIKISHLSEPRTAAHAERLQVAFTSAVAQVEQLALGHE